MTLCLQIQSLLHWKMKRLLDLINHCGFWKLPKLPDRIAVVAAALFPCTLWAFPTCFPNPFLLKESIWELPSPSLFLWLVFGSVLLVSLVFSAQGLLVVGCRGHLWGFQIELGLSACKANMLYYFLTVSAPSFKDFSEPCSSFGMPMLPPYPWHCSSVLLYEASSSCAPLWSHSPLRFQLLVACFHL